MSELNLPHQSPILFAKKILSRKDSTARVLIEFEEVPSLSMLIEASAQSTAAFSDGSQSGGYLASMKNVKLLSRPETKSLEVEVTQKHSLENMTLIDFEVYEKEILCSKGSLTIVLS
ncbi:MAG: hypothetical protein U9O86_06355 [Campylobacterota bacterium]|nr:hypothetical protein [Campylobacterota bacterium]